MEFDDGDTGRIPLSHIRLLPPDYKIHCEQTHSSHCTSSPLNHTLTCVFVGVYVCVCGRPLILAVCFCMNAIWFISGFTFSIFLHRSLLPSSYSSALHLCLCVFVFLSGCEYVLRTKAWLRIGSCSALIGFEFREGNGLLY